VDTRIWGTAELEIDFTNFSVDDSTAVAVSGENDGQ
jgi:hypothetical protein